MLDAFIIEQIRRREQEEARRQPWIEQPSRFSYEEPGRSRGEADGDGDGDGDGDNYDYDRRDNGDNDRGRGRGSDDEPNNGVIIIDM